MILKIVQQVAHVVPLFPSVKYLRQQVRTIITCWDVSCQRLTHRDVLSHSMVAYWVTLSPQSNSRLLGVEYNRHVVTIYVWGSFDSNSHHTQLVSEPMEYFNPTYHCHKLCTENRFIDCRLLLGNILDQSYVQEDKETSPWPTCRFVSVMVAVNLHSQVHAFVPWLRHVSRDRLFHVAIRLNTLMLLKDAMVYIQISWIKRQPQVVILPEGTRKHGIPLPNVPPSEIPNVKPTPRSSCWCLFSQVRPPIAIHQ